MVNSDTNATWKYHNGTKHPGGPLMDPRHRYDPMDNPLPFKIYEGPDPIPLPQDAPQTTVSSLSALASQVAPTDEGQVPDIDKMSKVIHLSAGITKILGLPWGKIPFRAAACTGALYHIELYLVCSDLPGLEAGVYHFDPSVSSLRRLRNGDYRQALVDATGNEPAVTNAPAVLIYTDVFWRNAVKYQAREYRHAFWDSGTIISNTLATAAACSLPAKVVSGFVDEQVNRLLDLDVRREVAVALVSVGYAPGVTNGPSLEIGPLELKTIPVSDYEIDFPAIREMHEASSLSSKQEVLAWRKRAAQLTESPASRKAISIKPYSAEEVPRDSIETVIVRRGSPRQFSQAPITFAELSTILYTAGQGIPADYANPQSSALNDMYLIINSVDGLRSGCYIYHRESKTLELTRQGEFRHEAGLLALNQALGTDAAVNVFLLTDLKETLSRLGNRGYRAAQLEASITAGRVYLAAYALELGATGLTFYDDAVVDFFSPNAAGKDVMFLVVVGRPARRG